MDDPEDTVDWMNNDCSLVMIAEWVERERGETSGCRSEEEDR